MENDSSGMPSIEIVTGLRQTLLGDGDGKGGGGGLLLRHWLLHQRGGGGRKGRRTEGIWDLHRDDVKEGGWWLVERPGPFVTCPFVPFCPSFSLLLNFA